MKIGQIIKTWIQLKRKTEWPNWREVFIAVLSGALILVGKELGLENTVKEVIALIGGSYVAGGFVASTNPKKRLESLGRQLSSKKFRFTLISLAITILGSQIGVDLGWAIGLLASIFNVGVGYADSKTDLVTQPSVVVLPPDNSNSSPEAVLPPTITEPYPIIEHDSPNHGGKIDPQGVVFHHSGGNIEGSLSWIANPESEVSYHMMIAQDGTQHAILPFTTRAWHAGESQFKNRVGCNDFMVGIAFEKDTYTRSLTDDEIASAVQVVKAGIESFGWTFDWITDHRTVSTVGKPDLNPVEMDRLLAAIAKELY